MKKLMRSNSAKSRSCLYDSIHSSTTDCKNRNSGKCSSCKTQQEQTAEHNWITISYLSLHPDLLRTCMALFPNLTTSNRVTGSPPSPLCWATPLAFPRPLVTLAALSVGDFRGFLLEVCRVRMDKQILACVSFQRETSHCTL